MTPMTPLLSIALVLAWIVWFYPFIFRAPHFQKRSSVTAKGRTALGITLEAAGIFAAYLLHFPYDVPRNTLRVALFAIFAVASCALSWTSVTHLGRQFRVNAGLYEDHQLVKTGPYALVRHPIYASLMGMMLCVMTLMTPIKWAAIPLVLYICGTEIRVRTEDGLLRSRFGEDFEKYRKSVSAYIPFVR